MGQKLRDDKIGSLGHSGGIITLNASTVSPSWLTIGGQQYKITSNVTRTIATDLTMVANTRYQIYAVMSSGAVQLRISTNENSVGPAGFLAWKLVGSFYSNGLSPSFGFGSFVNIEGAPQTADPIPFDVTYSVTGFSQGPNGFWGRNGKFLSFNTSVTKNGSAGVGATTFQVFTPVNVPGIDSGAVAQVNGGDMGSCTMSNNTTFGTQWAKQAAFVTGGGFVVLPAGATGTMINTQVGANGVIHHHIPACPMLIWSNRPIKDL